MTAISPLFEHREHDHRRCAADALDHAEAICAAEGLRLTAQRRTVLEALLASHVPASAYDVIDRLAGTAGRRRSRSIGPSISSPSTASPTALKSRNAYVACAREDDAATRVPVASIAGRPARRRLRRADTLLAGITRRRFARARRWSRSAASAPAAGGEYRAREASRRHRINSNIAARIQYIREYWIVRLRGRCTSSGTKPHNPITPVLLYRHRRRDVIADVSELRLQPTSRSKWRSPTRAADPGGRALGDRHAAGWRMVLAARERSARRHARGGGAVVRPPVRARICADLSRPTWTTASRAVLFIYLAPFFVVLGSRWFLPGDHFHLSQWAGLALSFLGIVIAFGLPTPARTRASAGDGMMVGAASAWRGATRLIKAYPAQPRIADKTMLYQPRSRRRCSRPGR